MTAVHHQLKQQIPALRRYARRRLHHKTTAGDLVQVDLAGFSYPEVAETVPIGTAMSRLIRPSESSWAKSNNIWWAACLNGWASHCSPSTWHHVKLFWVDKGLSYALTGEPLPDQLMLSAQPVYHPLSF